MMINPKIKENSCMPMQIPNHKQKPMEEEEDVVDVMVTEEEGVDVTTISKTGSKEETRLEWSVSGAIKLVTMPICVQTGCLNSKKHKRMMLRAHTKLRS